MWGMEEGKVGRRMEVTVSACMCKKLISERGCSKVCFTAKRNEEAELCGAWRQISVTTRVKGYALLTSNILS